MEDQLYHVRLLPYKYKQTGKWVLIAGLPVVAGIVYLLKTTGLITNSRSFFDKWNDAMVYYPLCIGLALLVFSEEKEEDEMVQALRYKAFVSGVFYLVMGVLWLPFFTNIFGFFRERDMAMPEAGGMLGALALLLFYTYASFKYNLYIARKALETDEE